MASALFFLANLNNVCREIKLSCASLWCARHKVIRLAWSWLLLASSLSGTIWWTSRSAWVYKYLVPWASIRQAWHKCLSRTLMASRVRCQRPEFRIFTIAVLVLVRLWCGQRVPISCMPEQCEQEYPIGDIVIAPLSLLNQAGRLRNHPLIRGFLWSAGGWCPCRLF